MVFSSLLFIFRFLPIALAIYYITPARYKNLILTILSLIFYSWGEGTYFLIMIASIAVDYTCGIFIKKYRENKKISKSILLFSLIFNIGMLVVFKYINFFFDNLNIIFNIAVNEISITLPLGISFYTFQTMSYSIDVYKGKAEPEKNIFNFAAFVTLFPQLIAGPIVKYTDISKEIKNRKISFNLINEGIEYFILGLSYKVIIANNVGMLYSEVESIGFNNISSVLAWMGILAFALQIYFDFNGYSLMAIGLGKMLGFNFPRNFNYPYISKSISEFWKRWHITLGSWFKEYVYIPLGGNRKNKKRTILNMFIVWILTGLWHGASYNFILWGLYFFIFISLEKIVLSEFLKRHNIIAHVYTIIVLIIGWVIFAISDINNIFVYIKTMFIYKSGTEWIYYLNNYFIILILGVVLSTPLLNKVYRNIKSELIKTLFLIILFFISVSYLVDATYNPFLYFRF